MLEEGKKAPEFSLPASDGSTISLKDYRARKAVVLYFYPKDDTPGCTVEACEFGAQHSKFKSADAVVLGVSPDSVTRHNKFIDKFKLPFILLADEDKKVISAYGLWVEKSMYGRKYMGVLRSTFLIDKAGKLAKIWTKVTPAGHAEEVLAALKELK